MYLDPDVHVHRCTENSLIIIYYNHDFAENATASFACLEATNYSGATKYGYQQNPRNVNTTLLFSVLTENDSFRSCIQHIRLPPSRVCKSM